MAARTKARKRALDILFEAEQRGVERRDAAGRPAGPAATEAPLNEYTVQLVQGVVGQWTAINELLSTYSQGWPLERMPAVDRAILRIGTFEVVYADDVPDAVAISEAVVAGHVAVDRRLARRSSTACSARIAEIKPTLV